MFENPTRGRQEINFGTNVPKNLDLKSSSEQIFSKNWRWVPLLSSQFCCITQISPASLILPHRPHETSLKSSTRNSEGTDFFLITTANLVSRGLFPGFGRLPQNIRAGYDSRIKINDKNFEWRFDDSLRWANHRNVIQNFYLDFYS